MSSSDFYQNKTSFYRKLNAVCEYIHEFKHDQDMLLGSQHYIKSELVTVDQPTVPLPEKLTPMIKFSTIRAKFGINSVE